MKELIVLSGLPGSGKSHYARVHYTNAKVIASDEVRIKITGSYRKLAPNMNDVYDEMIRQANEILARDGNQQVVLDSTFLDDKRRNYFLDRIHGQDKTILVMLKFHDIQTVLSRNVQRDPDKWVPEDVIMEMNSRYSAPDEEYKNRYDSIVEHYID